MDKTGTTQDPKSFPKPGLRKVIRQKLRDNALNETEFTDISHISKLLPKFKIKSTVHPQLEHVEFYKQGDEKISDYIPQTSKLHRKRGEEHEEGYRRAATLKAILENFKEGQICFAGQPGSGKTTLLRSLTRDIIEGKNYETFSDDQVVHYVNMRSFRRENTVTPAELLFQNVVPKMSESEMKEAMQFAIENPDKVLFVIDSLDTIPYTIDGVYTDITPEERASPEVILYHLLAGQLIPGGRFITSSREFAIRNYKANLQAEQVIALAGLTKESMKKIVVGYLLEKREADKIMTFLKSKPVIESLCSTPLWLIFTLMALKTKSSFKPSTMTGILVMVIQSMIRSEHVHQKDVESIFNKLTEMAFTGTAQHRVEFSEGELSDYDLDLADIIDLMIVTPSGAFQRLIHGDSTLIYAHQCLQEILTAFRIAIMEYGKFKAFIIKNINKPYFAIVRRLLTGILMNEEVFEEAENFLENGGDFVEKKILLKDILKRQLQSDLDDEDRLELYVCLSEGGDALRDIVRENVRDFKFNNMSISPSEMYSIGWVTSRQTFVDVLSLGTCNLSSALLSVLYHELKESNVKVKEFKVGENDLGPEETMLIAKISQQCKVDILDVNECELKSEALRSFLDSSVGLKLKEFDVSGNDLEPEEMTLIAKISKQCKVDMLRVNVCELKSEALKSFLDSSVGLKLKEFDVGDNDLGPEEMTMVAKISKQCKVDILKVGGVQLKSEALRSFFDSSVGLKLEELDVSGNDLGPEEMTLVAKISKQCNVDRLGIGCNFESEDLKSFLVASVDLKISTLNIGGIKLLHDAARTILSLIIKQRGVETLLIGEPEELENMDAEALKFSDFDHYKIGKVKRLAKLAYKETLPGKALAKICQFFPHVATEVDLTEWHIKAVAEKMLQNQLDEGNNKDLKIICKIKSPGLEKEETSDQEEEETSDMEKAEASVSEESETSDPEEVMTDPEGEKETYVQEEEGMSSVEEEGASDSEEEEEISESEKVETKTLLSKKSAENYPPTIVENRRAEFNNAVIVVSWQYPEKDADVEYHVETFCDDQGTEVTICKQPRSEIKELMPSTAYCFKIRAVDSNGLAGQPMFTNEVVSCDVEDQGTRDEIAKTEPTEADPATTSDVVTKFGDIGASTKKQMKILTIEESALKRNPVEYMEFVSTPTITETSSGRGFSAWTEKVIFCATGGEIEVYGCKIVIPAKSLERDTTVRITIEIGNTKDKPEDSIPISPSLDCDVKLKEGYEMDVEVPVFCFASEPVPVHLLSKTIGAKNWITEKAMTLGTQRKLVFKTSHFSRKIFVFLKGIGLGALGRRLALNFRLTPHLFDNGQGLFHACFCVDDELTNEGLLEEFSDCEKVLKMPQKDIVQIGNIFEARLSCSHPNLEEIVLDGEKSFEITEEIICTAYARKDFELERVRTRSRPKNITMNYDVGKKGSELKRNIFVIAWPPHTEKAKKRKQTEKSSDHAKGDTNINIHLVDKSKHYKEQVTAQNYASHGANMTNTQTGTKFRKTDTSHQKPPVLSTSSAAATSSDALGATEGAIMDASDAEKYKRGPQAQTTVIIQIGDSITTGDIKANTGDEGCVKIDKSITAAKYTGGSAQTETTSHGERNTVIRN